MSTIYRERSSWIWNQGYVYARRMFTNAQVINNIMTGPYKSLYNPENVYRNEAGGGAGNNWAQGYAAGEKAADELIEMVDREADGSESLEVRALNSHTRDFSCYIL